MSQLNIWCSQIEKNVNLNLKKSRAICPPGGGGLWDEEGREAASPPGDPPSWPQIFNRSDQDKECQVCLDSFCRLSRSKVLQKDSNNPLKCTQLEQQTQGRQGRMWPGRCHHSGGLPWPLDQNGGLLALGTRAAHTCRHYILLEALEGEVCFTKISNSPSLLQVHFLPCMNTVLYVPCNQLTTSPLLATQVSHR